MVCKVYIGNLGNNGTKHEIERAFSKFGPLVNVWVARNPPGFAFVEFEDSRDAEDSVRSMDGAKVCGMRVRVQLSHNDRGRRDRRPSPRRRYRSRSPAYGRGRSYSPRRSRSRSYSRSPRHVSRGSPRYDDYRKRSESPEYSRSRSRY